MNAYGVYVVLCSCGFHDATPRDRRGAETQGAIHEEQNRLRPHAHRTAAVPWCEAQ